MCCAEPMQAVSKSALPCFTVTSQVAVSPARCTVIYKNLQGGTVHWVAGRMWKEVSNIETRKSQMKAETKAWMKLTIESRYRGPNSAVHQTFRKVVKTQGLPVHIDGGRTCPVSLIMMLSL